jgi:hypothetical protein
MPKLVCPCGFVHDLSPIPDDGWITILSRDFDRYLENDRVIAEVFDTLLEQDDDSEDWRKYRAAFGANVDAVRLLYECPRCGRLMWQEVENDGREVYYRVYKPEGIDETTQEDLWILEALEPGALETEDDGPGEGAAGADPGHHR